MIQEIIYLHIRRAYNGDIVEHMHSSKWILRTMAISVEVICIYLSFGVNDGTYYKLCGKCQNKLHNYCQSVMVERMKEGTFTLLRQRENHEQNAFESNELK